MAAGMEIQQPQPQLLAALHLIQESSARLCQRLRFRMSQVDQIAVVRQHMLERDTDLLAVGLKRLDTGFSQRFGVPTALVFGEQGKGLRADFRGIQRGVLNTAPGGHMRSDIFHNGDDLPFNFPTRHYLTPGQSEEVILAGPVRGNYR